MFKKMNKHDIYENIMKKVAIGVKKVINEDFHPNDISLLNIDWSKISKAHHWWHDISIENVKKYSADQLKAYDISLDIINKLSNYTDDNNIESVRIIFDEEDSWSLDIRSQKTYGRNTYSLFAHGPSAPWSIPYSQLNINEKRSIKYRLEITTLYMYKYNDFYVLRSVDTFNGDHGIQVKL